MGRLTYNKYYRWILKKLPAWNWVLDLLYPDDLVIQIKEPEELVKDARVKPDATG